AGGGEEARGPGPAEEAGPEGRQEAEARRGEQAGAEADGPAVPGQGRGPAASRDRAGEGRPEVPPGDGHAAGPRDAAPGGAAGEREGRAEEAAGRAAGGEEGNEGLVRYLAARSALFLVLAGLGASPARADGVRSEVDARRIGLEDTLELTITAEGRAPEEMALPTLTNLKVVGGPSVSTQVSIMNGQMTQS